MASWVLEPKQPAGPRPSGGALEEPLFDAADRLAPLVTELEQLRRNFKEAELSVKKEAAKEFQRLLKEEGSNLGTLPKKSMSKEEEEEKKQELAYRQLIEGRGKDRDGKGGKLQPARVVISTQPLPDLAEVKEAEVKEAFRQRFLEGPRREDPPKGGSPEGGKYVEKYI